MYYQENHELINKR